MGCQVDAGVCPAVFIKGVEDWGLEDPAGKPLEKVREIRDQIVDHDTIQDAEANGLQLWKEGGGPGLDVRFFSIKSFPERFGLWQMGSLIGDLMQPALQYNSPFLLTLGVHLLDPNATRTTVTGSLPLPELAAAKDLVRLEAENFVGQGGG